MGEMAGRYKNNRTSARELNVYHQPGANAMVSFGNRPVAWFLWNQGRYLQHHRWRREHGVGTRYIYSGSEQRHRFGAEYVAAHLVVSRSARAWNLKVHFVCHVLSYDTGDNVHLLPWQRTSACIVATGDVFTPQHFGIAPGISNRRAGGTSFRSAKVLEPAEINP